jgi:hypothetical protein
MVESLGVVDTPSGVLLVVDAGYLGMWSHDRDPVMPEGILSSEAALAAARSAVDLHLVGLGAEEIGRALDLQWHPRFLHDIPLAGVGEVRQQVAALAAERGIAAALEVLPARVPHRTRCDHALAVGGGAGQVPFHGVPAVVLGGLPPGPHPVEGECGSDIDGGAGDLERAVVRFSAAAIARSELVGVVGVDWARLLIADVDAVGSWQHDEPLDGLADIVFWGRDAEAIAAATGASVVPDGHGWLDLPLDAAADAYERVLAVRDQHRYKAVVDGRPHSHHYQLMAQVRARPTQSGVVSLGGVAVCGFSTRRGDGIFNVFRDVDGGGSPVRLRIELG